MHDTRGPCNGTPSGDRKTCSSAEPVGSTFCWSGGGSGHDDVMLVPHGIETSALLAARELLRWTVRDEDGNDWTIKEKFHVAREILARLFCCEFGLHPLFK